LVSRGGSGCVRGAPLRHAGGVHPPHPPKLRIPGDGGLMGLGAGAGCSGPRARGRAGPRRSRGGRPAHTTMPAVACRTGVGAHTSMPRSGLPHCQVALPHCWGDLPPGSVELPFSRGGLPLCRVELPHCWGDLLPGSGNIPLAWGRNRRRMAGRSPQGFGTHPRMRGNHPSRGGTPASPHTKQATQWASVLGFGIRLN
jgi:hypothetical protein